MSDLSLHEISDIFLIFYVLYDISDIARRLFTFFIVFINFFSKEKKMSYSKPQVIATNNAQGSFSAGCPLNDNGGSSWCRQCERTA